MSKKKAYETGKDAVTTIAHKAADIATGGALSTLDRFRAKRSRRREARLADAARMLLGATATEEDLNNHVEVLGESDAGIGLIEAMFTEIDGGKTWAYTALIGAFYDNPQLDEAHRIAYLSLCRSATNWELQTLVYRICRDQSYYTKTPLFGNIDLALTNQLRRWRLWEEETIVRGVRRSGERNGDRRRGKALYGTVELAYILLPYAPFAWGVESATPREAHPTIRSWENERRRLAELKAKRGQKTDPDVS